MYKHGIVWFRKDLRIKDNPALIQALNECERVGLVYIVEDPVDHPWKMGGASRWWLHHSLKALQDHNPNMHLNLLRGSSLEKLEECIEEWGSEAVYWNRCYDPYSIARDKAIKSELSKSINVTSLNGSLIKEPWEVLKKDGTPYLVYTAFWKAFLKSLNIRETYKKPALKDKTTRLDSSVELADLELLPKIAWDSEFYDHWIPGELNANKRLKKFVESKGIKEYSVDRDIPSIKGTSFLGPSLHFGEISPVQVWNAAAESVAVDHQYLKEIVWREFAYALLFHHPNTDLKPLKPKYSKFPWDKSQKHLKAWQKGETGYPIVDAGMRQLWKTGYMHNRVRMIVASFLVKNLLIPWQEGAKWFFDTLVDADLASNSFGWQWSAGCGADAAPYFRVFNPILQGQKFDKAGIYVKTWVPELSELDAKWIHKPWEAGKEVLRRANIELGVNYPKPVVNQSVSRDKALAAFSKLKEL